MIRELWWFRCVYNGFAKPHSSQIDAMSSSCWPRCPFHLQLNRHAQAVPSRATSMQYCLSDHVIMLAPLQRSAAHAARKRLNLRQAQQRRYMHLQTCCLIAVSGALRSAAPLDVVEATHISRVGVDSSISPGVHQRTASPQRHVGYDIRTVLASMRRPCAWLTPSPKLVDPSAHKLA